MPRKPSAKTAPDDGEKTKSARTRERILAAAAHVLSRKGYAGTRLTDVAEQAELQAPAIYYYFPSREDLIEEVMWTGLAMMNAQLRDVLAALPADAGPIAKIDAAVEAHLRHELQLSDYTTASIRNSGQIPEELRVRPAAEATKYGDIWRKLIQELQDAGLLREDLNTRAARMMVLGALNSAAEWWNPRRGSLDAVVRTAQSLVRHGLCTPEAVSEEQPAVRELKPAARKASAR